jgi:hypothetical protein
VGLNVEHAWADAPVTSFMWEYILHDDIHRIGYIIIFSKRKFSSFPKIKEKFFYL